MMRMMIPLFRSDAMIAWYLVTPVKHPFNNHQNYEACALLPGINVYQVLPLHGKSHSLLRKGALVTAQDLLLLLQQGMPEELVVILRWNGPAGRPPCLASLRRCATMRQTRHKQFFVGPYEAWQWQCITLQRTGRFRFQTPPCITLSTGSPYLVPKVQSNIGMISVSILVKWMVYVFLVLTGQAGTSNTVRAWALAATFCQN